MWQGDQRIMSITDDEKDALKNFGSVTRDVFVNLGVAFALSFCLGWLFSGTTKEQEAWLRFDLVLVAAIIFSDPAAQWRKREGWTVFALKFVVALMLGVGISWLINVLPRLSEDYDGAFPLHSLLIFMIAPMAFVLLALILQLKSTGSADERFEDAQISAAFPIFMTWTMVLQLGIPGALWLIGAGIPLALALYVTGLVLCVMEVAYAPDTDSERDETEAWGPRPESSRESWANLRKAIEQSFVSGLLIGAMMFVLLNLSLPIVHEMDFEETQAFSMIWPLIKAAGVSIVVFGIMSLLGIMIVSGVAIAVARIRDHDLLVTTRLIERSSGRLFMGGMSWVRPDFEEDDLQSR